MYVECILMVSGIMESYIPTTLPRCFWIYLEGRRRAKIPVSIVGVPVVLTIVKESF
jgi:hypothetical protein